MSIPRGLGGLLLVLLLLVTLTGQARPPAGKKIALLVGVDRYEKQELFAELRYPENDVEKLARLLRTRGGFDEVRVLTLTRGKRQDRAMPTAENLRAALSNLLRDRSRRDTVLLALAGHGVQLEVDDPAGKGEPRSFAFFCPRNASLEDVSYRTGLSPSMLNLDDLFDMLGKSEAGTKLVLVDACRQEMRVKGRTRNLATGRINVPNGVLALFSCGRNQLAWESDDLRHGVFFYYVLRGLQGEARNPEGEVNWDRLGGYVREQVTRNVGKLIGGGARQTPAVVGYHEGESPLLATVADPSVYTNSLGMRFAHVPAGNFLMGSPESAEKIAEDFNENAETFLGERPQHRTHIVWPIRVGKHEVTVAQFRAFVRATGHVTDVQKTGKTGSFNPSAGIYNDTDKEPSSWEFPTSDRTKRAEDTHPVTYVSWNDAVAFCTWLSQKEGKTYRLPTEAEWEYFSRAGTTTRFWNGDDHEKLIEIANVPDATFLAHYGRTHPGKKLGYATVRGSDGYSGTAPVGSFRANPFGLHDVHGNVWEWCQDWWAANTYQAREEFDPHGPRKGESRVLRGGCFM